MRWFDFPGLWSSALLPGEVVLPVYPLDWILVLLGPWQMVKEPKLQRFGATNIWSGAGCILRISSKFYQQFPNCFMQQKTRKAHGHSLRQRALCTNTTSAIIARGKMQGCGRSSTQKKGVGPVSRAVSLRERQLGSLPPQINWWDTLWLHGMRLASIGPDVGSHGHTCVSAVLGVERGGLVSSRNAHRSVVWWPVC